MVKGLRLLFVVLFVSLPLSAQQTTTPLRNARAVVATAYAQLSTQPTAQRRAMYAAMPADMQADLWAIHLSYFLADHDDLRPEERAVILEALGIVQSGLLEIDRTSPAWAYSVGRATQQLDKHVQLSGSKVVFDALTRLGGPPVYSFAKAGSLRTDYLPGDECECSTQDGDFCCFGDCPTTTTPRCHRSGRPWCIPAHGCGWFWLGDCDGICGA